MKYHIDWIERNYQYEWVGYENGTPKYTQVQRPLIVCLCGSSRFWDAYQQANYDETMAGRIVLSIGHYPHAKTQEHGQHVGCTPEQKIELDKLHFKKIELADEIFVLNVGGYIGESTINEVNHAIRLGKPVRWLEPDKIPIQFAKPEAA